MAQKAIPENATAGMKVLLMPAWVVAAQEVEKTLT